MNSPLSRSLMRSRCKRSPNKRTLIQLQLPCHPPLHPVSSHPNLPKFIIFSGNSRRRRRQSYREEEGVNGYWSSPSSDAADPCPLLLLPQVSCIMIYHQPSQPGAKLQKLPLIACHNWIFMSYSAGNKSKYGHHNSTLWSPLLDCTASTPTGK